MAEWRLWKLCNPVARRKRYLCISKNLQTWKKNISTGTNVHAMSTTMSTIMNITMNTMTTAMTTATTMNTITNTTATNTTITTGKGSTAA